MNKSYIELINSILQQYSFEAESIGKNDTLSLGLAFIGLQFVAKYSSGIEAEHEIGRLIAACREGQIPEPYSSEIGPNS